MARGWEFWIDRGGTFTDIAARSPGGRMHAHKLLSDAGPDAEDRTLAGIRAVLGASADADLTLAPIDSLTIGTTVGTNALLERTGTPTALVITRGLGHALRIGTQARPKLFAREIRLPDPLYARVVEADERMSASGEVLTPLDEDSARRGLVAAVAAGCEAAAIVLAHGWRHSVHERRLAEIAREAGFRHVSTSADTSALQKLVPRGDTTVVDAYLTPLLRAYVDRVAAGLGRGVRIRCMQSNGGVTGAARFRGKDSVLSGPAAGVVGAVRTSVRAGFSRVIGFDMGGTSTDVCHYDGAFERTWQTEIAGVRLSAPMLMVHTVAAGGGSILRFDGARLRAGPESAGATPGPASYGRGGPATVTDANVLLGRLPPKFLPHVFGAEGVSPLDRDASAAAFAPLANEIAQATGNAATQEEVAEGFLAVAVDNMAAAIKRMSVQRGHDVSAYALCCFGGAGGQHACAVADALGMDAVVVHPHAGILSAVGMGLADVTAIRERTVEAPLGESTAEVARSLDELAAAARAEVEAQGIAPARVREARSLHIRTAGSDTALKVRFGAPGAMERAFRRVHRRRFGFAPARDEELVAATCMVEATGKARPLSLPTPRLPETAAVPVAEQKVFAGGAWRDTPVFRREDLRPSEPVAGPAIVLEAFGTNWIAPGWQAERTPNGELVLTRAEPRPVRIRSGTGVDPVLLEIFHNRFRSVAEQMGAVLENTASSVNIKERLDFSCAVFDAGGNLVANAPHIPVHLGSMGETVQAVLKSHGGAMRPGDVFVTNAPHAGGTHLPDVTVLAPVYGEDGERLFFVGARGHHADIGGTTPGSMPARSSHLAEEGVCIESQWLVRRGRFREAAIRAALAGAPYPARNPDQNLADLRAQAAACALGARELLRLVERVGRGTVTAYMGHVQDNAAESVRRVLDGLPDGAFACSLDDGDEVRVAIRVDRAARKAVVDFTGTSPERSDNFNAPPAIARATVLYVFRCLIDDDIPLNSGCLAPIRVTLPEGSLVNPGPGAAVAAGNVETSQLITDALFGAAGALAASQGTMNNLTFGDETRQYYETLGGGTGAGPGFGGAPAVHSHMTNTRLTDVEVLESRFPVVVEAFGVRPASGGAGRWRGGDGLVRRLRFREPLHMALLSGRRIVAPHGLAGGGPGAPGRAWIERADGNRVALAGCDDAELAAGDALVIETPGGGGYGGGD